MNMLKDIIKKELILVAVMLTAILSLSGVAFFPGSGMDISAGFEQHRERDFYYHRNTDDQHWYGTNKWAVRFDFDAVYPSYSSSEFEISKVRVYFPMLPASAVPVTVEIFTDSGNAPNTLLTSASANITTNWMEFTLPQTQTVSLAWVVVTCATSAVGPYMSASIGGGTHSFYWNTNTPTEYFQNMLTAGYSSEFLISVVGRFELSGTDLELFAFDLMPEVIPGAIVTPEFTIYNNSAVEVLLPHITLAVNSPNPAYAVQDTIAIYQTLPPYSELTILHTSPEMQAYQIQLPDFPTQIKIRAVLKSEHDLADTLFNNTITKYYSAFDNPLPVRLVENFIRYDAAQNLLAIQDGLVDADAEVINYFPMVADTYYASGATQRFNWYGFTGYPMTVVGGDDRIAGFILADYADRFDAALDDLGSQRTFIVETRADLGLTSPYNFLQISLALRNPQSYVFIGGADPSLVMQSRFFAALCRKTDFHGAERLVFYRWSAFADTIGTAMGFEQSWTKNFSANISDIGVDSLLAHYELLYWIQHNTTKQILFANLIPLSSTVSNDDETAPVVPLSVVLSPNPLRRGSELNLKFSAIGKERISRYAIYNLKGQLVQQGKPLLRDGGAFISTQQLPSAGVYLIRLELEDRHQVRRTLTRKIFVY